MESKKLKGLSGENAVSGYNRVFSEEFKRQKVKDIEADRVSIKELSEVYGVSRTAVYKWIYKYSIHYQKGVKQVVQMESEEQKTLQLRQRVAELERIIGQKQLELDFANKLLEVASEDLGYDVKKNIEQKLWSVSEGDKGGKVKK